MRCFSAAAAVSGVALSGALGFAVLAAGSVSAAAAETWVFHDPPDQPIIQDGRFPGDVKLTFQPANLHLEPGQSADVTATLNPPDAVVTFAVQNSQVAVVTGEFRSEGLVRITLCGVSAGDSFLSAQAAGRIVFGALPLQVGAAAPLASAPRAALAQAGAPVAADETLFTVSKTLTMALMPGAPGDFLHGDLVALKAPVDSGVVIPPFKPELVWVGGKWSDYSQYSKIEYITENSGMTCGPDIDLTSEGSGTETLSGSGGEGVWFFGFAVWVRVSEGASWYWYTPAAVITATQRITITSAGITKTLESGNTFQQFDDCMIIKKAPPPTSPPTAVASTTTPLLPVGGTAVLNGTGSHDNDTVGPSPEIVTYTWTVVNLTKTVPLPPVAGPSVKQTVDLTIPGEYEATLVVTDNDGENSIAGSSDAHITIKVVEVTLTLEPGDQTVGFGSKVTYKATAQLDGHAVPVSLVVPGITVLPALSDLDGSDGEMRVVGTASVPGTHTVEASGGTGKRTAALKIVKVTFDKSSVGIAPSGMSDVLATTEPSDAAPGVQFVMDDTNTATVDKSKGETGQDFLIISGVAAGDTILRARVSGFDVAQLQVKVLPFKYRGRPIFNNDPGTFNDFGWMAVDIEDGIFKVSKWTVSGGTASVQGISFRDTEDGREIVVDPLSNTACIIRFPKGGDNSPGNNFNAVLEYTVNLGGTEFSGEVNFRCTATQVTFGRDDLNKDWFVSETRERAALFKLYQMGGWTVTRHSWSTDKRFVSQTGDPILGSSSTDASSLITLLALKPTPPNVGPMRFSAGIRGKDLDGKTNIFISLGDADRSGYTIQGPTLRGPMPNPVIAYPTEKTIFSVEAGPFPKSNQLTLTPATGPIQFDGTPQGRTIKLSVLATMDDPSVSANSTSAVLTFEPKIARNPPARLELKVEIRPLSKLLVESPPGITFLIAGQEAVEFKASGLAKDDHSFASTKVNWKTDNGLINTDGKLSRTLLGTVTVIAEATSALNPKIQASGPIAARSGPFPVYLLRADFTVTGSGVLLKNGRLYAEIGKLVTLVPKVMAGPAEVTPQAVFSWNTPSLSSSFTPIARGTINVSAVASVRGAQAQTPIHEIIVGTQDEIERIRREIDLVDTGWQVKRSMLRLDVRGIPFGNVIVGQMQFRQGDKGKEFPGFFLGFEVNLRFQDIAELLVKFIKDSLGKRFRTVMDFIDKKGQVLEVFYENLKNVPYTDWVPIMGSAPVSDVKEFYGRWSVFSAEAIFFDWKVMTMGSFKVEFEGGLHGILPETGGGYIWIMEDPTRAVDRWIFGE